jgi:hypothetical protein
MQLDLFIDNRTTILRNDAARMLRILDFEKAVALYDLLLADEPGDGELFGLKYEAEEWRMRLDRCSESDPTVLHELHSLLDDTTLTALRDGILTFLIERLSALPEPELIYFPPRFHMGCLLREAGRHMEAERWFADTLDSGIRQMDRFLAWLGDVLTLRGKRTAALEYL